MDQSIADKYSNLDAQLREQFEIYEKAIKSDDKQLSDDQPERVNSVEAKDKTIKGDNISISSVPMQRSELIMKPSLTKIKRFSIEDNEEADDNANDLVANQLANRPYRRTAMNVTIRKPTIVTAQHANKKREQKEDVIENAPLAKPENNESGETTNDDNYESANDDEDMEVSNARSLSFHKSVNSANKSNDNASSSKSSLTGVGSHSNDNDSNCYIDKESQSNFTSTSTKNRLVQTVSANHQQQSTKLHHQLQLRSQQASTNSSSTTAKAPATGRSVRLGSSNMSSGTTTTISSPSKQNNLTRGKQQRASISSCSSSDSYASYGSGYVSGSGNSTDHEQKQQLLQKQQQGQLQQQQQQRKLSTSNEKQLNNEQEQNPNQLATVTNSGRLLRATRPAKRDKDVVVVSGDDDDGEADDDVEDDDDDRTSSDGGSIRKDDEIGARRTGEEGESDSQLKQHLSELEQLTDELAKRDILSAYEEDIECQHNSGARANGEHYSSTNKSNSSKASSVLSTSSNISSLASSSGVRAATPTGTRQQQVEDDGNQQHQLKQSRLRKQTSSVNVTPSPPPPPPPPSVYQINLNNEARSTSTTPTTITANSNNGTAQQSSRKQYLSFHTMKQSPSGGNATTNQQQQRSPTERRLDQYAKSASVDGCGISPTSASTPTKQQQQQDPYYHNLFQWEQLVSKGVTRPLLINDLDFTDLRDEDDCDLLNASGGNASNASRGNGRNQFNGEPLTISIPSMQKSSPGTGHDSVDSGTSTGSPAARSAGLEDQPANGSTPASAPPPMPPPPISPWFNTISGSRPQSQFMSSPSPPPFELNNSVSNDRDQSPANSIYSNYSRNSVCVGPNNVNLDQQYNSLQMKGNLRAASSMSSLLFGNSNKFSSKRKKTMKLFWKEVREDKSLLAKLTKKKTIWDEIKPVPVDTQKLEYLFESKAKDLLLSKSRNGLDGISQRKVKITVLDAKRSNAINIGMTKLPPMRTIKSAILKMDSSIMNREGIEKILTTMMPTEEEKSRIIEAQLANPDTPLGTAEQFLLNLASISALEARLKLWAFQLDYAQIEKEVSEPLMDLKQAIEEIERSETFRVILGTLLSIGNFLNSTNVKGFQIDYLEKVPEVKDTVHKHSLLHHLCLFILEKYPELDSDLYSEFSSVNRASKVDYAELAKSLKKMQQDCKASWDHLKIVAKHDGLANLMNTCGMSSSSPSSCDSSPSNQHQPKSSGKLNNLSKLSMITTMIGSENSDRIDQPGTKQLKIKVSDFLTDCAERIMVLIVIHRRVMNRFQKLLVYLGCPSNQIKQTQPQQILKIINEFALEYRTKRSRVREMLTRVQKCQHHHLHGQAARAKRWQMGRWAGSQQCIDSTGYNNRSCSTTSSCASPFAADNISMASCSDCAFSSRHRGIESLSHPSHHANMSQHSSGVVNGNRCSSPSGVSQISNYSDYLFDHSCCGSRRESVTPAPSEKFLNSVGANRRASSMSVSMFDLKQQGQRQQNSHTNNQTDINNTSLNDSMNESLDQIGENDLSARQKDEQLRRLLGVDKSFYGGCKDLYQMKHWSSTMAGRVTRPESQGKLAAIRRMSGQQLERRESDEHGHHTLPT